MPLRKERSETVKSDIDLQASTLRVPAPPAVPAVPAVPAIPAIPAVPATHLIHSSQAYRSPGSNEMMTRSNFEKTMSAATDDGASELSSRNSVVRTPSGSDTTAPVYTTNNALPSASVKESEFTLIPDDWSAHPSIDRSVIERSHFEHLSSATKIGRSHIFDTTIRLPTNPIRHPSSGLDAMRNGGGSTVDRSTVKFALLQNVNVERSNIERCNDATNNALTSCSIGRSNIKTSTVTGGKVDGSNLTASTVLDAQLDRSTIEDCKQIEGCNLERNSIKASVIVGKSKIGRSDVQRSTVTGWARIERSNLKDTHITDDAGYKMKGLDGPEIERSTISGGRTASSKIERTVLKNCDVKLCKKIERCKLDDCIVYNAELERCSFKDMVLKNGRWKDNHLIGKKEPLGLYEGEGLEFRHKESEVPTNEERKSRGLPSAAEEKAQLAAQYNGPTSASESQRVGAGDEKAQLAAHYNGPASSGEGQRSGATSSTTPAGGSNVSVTVTGTGIPRRPLNRESEHSVNSFDGPDIPEVPADLPPPYTP